MNEGTPLDPKLMQIVDAVVQVMIKENVESAGRATLIIWDRLKLTFGTSVQVRDLAKEKARRLLESDAKLAQSVPWYKAKTDPSPETAPSRKTREPWYTKLD